MTIGTNAAGGLSGAATPVSAPADVAAPATSSCVPGPGAHAEPSLTARVVKGAAWVFLGKLIARGMQLASLVVLARLLAPEDFGLFGIVMLAIGTVDTFTQTGFGAALIQRQGETESYLDTAWTVGVVRGFVLALVVYAGAPLVGSFFNEPRAVPLLRLMCIGVAIGGFTNIGTIYFQKDLQFHKQVIWSTASAFISLIVGVVLAYRLRTVWALVWAGLVGSLATCTLSYVIHPYRPGVRFDRAQAQELSRFGRWVLGSGIVVFVATNGDAAVVGKLLGPVALGVYQVAYRLSNAATTEITGLTSAVMMPAYAIVQDDRRRLGSAFLQVFEVVTTLALPLTIFLVLAAPELVVGLLGAKWVAAIRPLQILAIAGFLRAIAATGGPVFLGTGRPHMDFWMNLGRATVILVTVYPLTRRFGVSGTSAAVIAALMATLPIWARVKAIVGFTWPQLGRRCVQGLLLSALVAMGILLGRLVPVSSASASLVAETAAAAFLCAVAVWTSGRYLRTGLVPRAVQAWRAARPG